VYGTGYVLVSPAAHAICLLVELIPGESVRAPFHDPIPGHVGSVPRAELLKGVMVVPGDYDALCIDYNRLPPSELLD
jgi:hypothetical protein